MVIDSPRNNKIQPENNAAEITKIDLHKRVDYQKLTSFPNQNDKHIDYVIFYEKLEKIEPTDIENQKIDIARTAFFAALKSEKLEVYDIEEKHDDKINVYSLINCSLERLLEEAEITRHEMVLKNVIFIFY